MSNTVTRKGNEIVVQITETSVSSSTEETIDLGVTKGRVLRQMCVKTSGSASTVDPILARTSGGTGVNVVMENGTAAATVDNQVTGGVPFYSSTGKLYHKSSPDTGSDNAISAEYLIIVGWGD
tara:strand:+ start:11882 stop:12250 length:369 start_codon:yes stop_codon:yes gene_type:complete